MRSLRTMQGGGCHPVLMGVVAAGLFDSKEFATDGPYDMCLGSTRAEPMPTRGRLPT